MDFIKEFMELQGILIYKGFSNGIYRVTGDFELQRGFIQEIIRSYRGFRVTIVFRKEFIELQGISSYKGF